MKSYSIRFLALSFWLGACSQGSSDHSGGTPPGPEPQPVVPVVTPPPVFDKADQFQWPQDVAWAATDGLKPPLFNMESFCGTAQGHCLNAYLNEGQVVLTTVTPVSTPGPVDIDVDVQYSGWARKFGPDDSAFKWHSLFKVRLVFQTKDANGQVVQGSRVAVLLARDLSDPQQEPWQGEEKSFLYSSGQSEEHFHLTAALPAAAEGIQLQVYDVGATQLQIQKVEFKTTPRKE